MFHSKEDVDRHVNEAFRNIKSEYQRNLKCYQIAKLYYKFKDYKAAIKYINRYILTTTNSAAAYRLLGECYLGINLKVKALDSFKTSLELNGGQQDLVLKVCSLLMDPEVSSVYPKATYWLERAETLFPSNPVIFRLREHLLKSNLDGKEDSGQMEKLILSEMSARPTDVTVRIRLLNFFVETKRYKIAYQHALEIEGRNTFSNDFRWYDCLCNLVQAYEKAHSGDLGFNFFIKKISFLERRADLFMQEFQDEVKSLHECSSALFAFDQGLHAVSKIEAPREESYFFAEFLKHMRAQLSFHLATLALKRAKKEYGIWPKAFRIASPLLLQSTENTMDLEGAWYNMWNGKNKMEREVKQWNKAATFRISQAGHVLLAWSQSKGPKFLEKVSQFCGGKWQSNVYQDIFYSREHQQATATSHFINDPFFTNVPMRLLSETELNHFDKVSQSAYPDSLHHLVWLGLAYFNANGQLSPDFRCMTVPDLQFTVENLSQYAAETLNQLDVDAFLYASVLCAKSATPSIVSADRPSRLPVSISEELCSTAQAEWWVAVYKTYKNYTTANAADLRLKLGRGIETIRAFGQHGMHVKLIVLLAKLFQERAAKNKNMNELHGLEERANLYWSAAVPLLEKIYAKLASEEVNHKPESITSENRSQHIILLTRARDALYLTLDRLRCPSVDPNHPLNTQLQDHLEDIEKQLARIDPVSTSNRNGDSESDETDPAPAPLSPDVDENLESTFNVYNTSNFLNVKNNPPRPVKQNFSDRPQPARFEARPSSERLDSQLRHLLQANTNGLQAIVEQLKEMKSAMQIELKDLGCVTRDLLAEMKRWNDRIEASSKRTTDSIKPEDLFEFREEDFDDLNNLTQQYNSYHTNYRQVPGTQGPSVITPVPSPVPPVPQVITTPDNPLTSTMIPPMMPQIIPQMVTPTLYPGVHPVQPRDPLLMYRTLGFYPQGFPYGDSQNVQNVPEYKGMGIQKGAPFAKNTFSGLDPVLSTTAQPIKPQAPNVVITSSDILPAFTSAGPPAMSVTIPAQHIRVSTPSSVAPKPMQNDVTGYPSSAVHKPMPVAKATQPKIEEMKQDKQEMKLFDSQGKLSVLMGKDWKDYGFVTMKIVHDKKVQKAKLTMFQNQIPNFYVEHYIMPDMVLEPLKNDDNGWAWIVNNPLAAGLTGMIESGKYFCIQFSTHDEARDFEFAFKEGTKLAKVSGENFGQKTTPPKFSSQVTSNVCKGCGGELKSNSEKCSACESKQKSSEKTVLGGFTFNSSPIVKPPVLDLSVSKETPNETPKTGPFSEFKFSTTTTATTTTTTTSQSNPQPLMNSKIFGSFSNDNTNLFSIVKKDPNSFKKDANFKGFGEPTPVFGYLNKKNESTPKSEKTPSKEKSGGNEEDEEGGDEEFVPTAEFAPVVDLPELVDVKTGEENDKVLFDHRAKLLRFDTKAKEWKERGVGNMKVLLNEETGKVRLIMRRELVLKVCCNHYLDETMEFKPLTKSEKALTWYAQDYSEGEIKAEFFALRLKSQDLMLDFLKVIQDTQSKMKNGRIVGTTVKEPQEEKPKDLKPLSELFKPKAGSWECGTCLLRNTEDKVKCVSCETPKPGTEAAASKESTSQPKLLGKGITFPANTTTFTFGIPSSNTTSGTTTAAATSTTSTPATTFTFGVPQNTSSATSVASSTTFNFGMPKLSTVSNLATTTSSPATLGTPQLSSATTSAPSATKFTLGTPKLSTTPTSSSTPTFSLGAPQFGQNLSGSTSLSSGVVGSAPTTTQISSTPTTSTPLTSSKFSFSASNVNTANLFGGTSAKKPESGQSQSVFSFKPDGKDKFEFTASNLKPVGKPGSTKTPSPKGKSSGDGDASSEDDEPEEDNGDHIIVKPIVPLPDKVAVNTGEEDEDVVYKQRAKLFRFINKEWKERGIGDFKILKHKTNFKIRLLMRRDTVLKVCLNHYLTPEIDFIPRDEKSWQWTAADFSEGEVRYDTFAIRFKTPEIAKEFMKAIEDVKNNVVPSPLKTEPKAKEPSAAMKNFSFADPSVSLGKSSSSPEASKGLQSGGLDDDVLVVYENKVTPEQREKAMSLHLPPNFYAYLQAPDCPGCRGCDTDDAPVSTPQSAQIQSSPPKTTQSLFSFSVPQSASIQSTPPTTTQSIFGIPTTQSSIFQSTPSTTNSLFGNTSWGSLNFGKIDSSRPLFSFAGNQGVTTGKFNPSSNFSFAQEKKEKEEENENENDDDDNEEYDVEEEEDVEYDQEEEEEEDEDEDEDDEENEDEDEDDEDDGDEKGADEDEEEGYEDYTEYEKEKNK